jgi:hypothetical protein
LTIVNDELIVNKWIKNHTCQQGWRIISIMITWLRSLKDAPAKWRRRTWTERRLLVEAFVFLGIARLAILVLPFRWLAVTLSKHKNNPNEDIGRPDSLYTHRIGQAVRSTAANTPWKSPCLAQAVAGQWMLRRRRISGTVYLGVAKDRIKAEGLSAHAWLRCGDEILTGGRGHRQYTVVATFS